MEPKLNFPKDDTTILGQDGITKYQKIVSSLQYLTTTRSGISFFINKVEQFIKNPTIFH